MTFLMIGLSIATNFEINYHGNQKGAEISQEVMDTKGLWTIHNLVQGVGVGGDWQREAPIEGAGAQFPTILLGGTSNPDKFQAGYF